MKSKYFRVSICFSLILICYGCNEKNVWVERASLTTEERARRSELYSAIHEKYNGNNITEKLTNKKVAGNEEFLSLADRMGVDGDQTCHQFFYGAKTGKESKEGDSTLTLIVEHGCIVEVYYDILVR